MNTCLRSGGSFDDKLFNIVMNIGEIPDISGLEKEVNDLKTEVDAITPSINDLQQRVNELSSKTQSINDKVVEIENKIREMLRELQVTTEFPSDKCVIVPFCNQYVYFNILSSSFTLASIYRGEGSDVSNEIFTLFGAVDAPLTPGPAYNDFTVILMGPTSFCIKANDGDVFTLLLRDPQITKLPIHVRKTTFEL